MDVPSIFTRVARLRHAEAVDDARAPAFVQHEPDIVVDTLRKTDARTLLAVPLRVRGEPIGCLHLIRSGDGAERFSSLDIETLQAIADQAATAVSNARLLARAQQVEQELAASRDRLSKTLAATRHFAEATSDPRALLDAIVQEAGDLLGAYAAVLLVSADGEALEIGAQYARSVAFVRDKVALLGMRMPLDASLAPVVRVFRSNAPLLISDLRASGEYATLDPRLHVAVEHLGINDFAGVPLRRHGSVLGVLFVQQVAWSPARVLGRADLEVLQMLADQAALSITNAKLLEAMQSELDEHRRTRDALVKSEDNFRQAQRMEAVGRLAGGVAHDFNNMLSVVLSYGEMLRESLIEGDPLRDDIEEIVKAGRRAADLTRQLLAFSRKQLLSPRVVDLSTVVEGVGKMLHRLLGEDIDLRIVTSGALDRCFVDRGQMEQVILNLAVNARDAMPSGGVLTLETSNMVVDEAHAREHPDVAPGDHVVLTVTDTGVGMDEATRARIFEPFFTTKPKGVGTGLGLAMVYGIVKQSGGSVSVTSQPGQGATFQIHLPAARGAVVSLPVPVPSPRALGGSETILVVEDEPQVRNLVRGILARQGYEVLLAANGGEALLLCEQHEASIHMLLTDVVMPRMSGRQLADRLRTVRPEMQVLYMSGYAEAAILNHGVLEDLTLITKPITPLALLERVRVTLDRAG
jgi:signal transduction histidine kinase